MFCYTEPDQAVLIKLPLTLTSVITESWEMVLNMQELIFNQRLFVCQPAGRLPGLQLKAGWMDLKLCEECAEEEQVQFCHRSG